MKKIYLFLTLSLLLTTLYAQINTTLPVGSIPGSADVSHTGAATYTIPIEVPVGSQGLQPNLAISYNSQGGNTLMGRGWNLSGISCITREGKNLKYDGVRTAVNMDLTDCFALDGQRLLIKSDGSYSPCEEDFSKITAKYNASGNGNLEWFEVRTKDGRTLEYGKENYSRLEISNTPQTAYKWYLSKVTDANGNTMTYTYNSYGSTWDRMLSEIEYTTRQTQGGTSGPEQKIRIRFTYVTNDTIPHTYYVAGKSLTIGHLLTSITIQDLNGNAVNPPEDAVAASGPLRTYEFQYKNVFKLYDSSGLYLQLSKVTLTGSDGIALNTTNFTYYEPSSSFASQSHQGAGAGYFDRNDANYGTDFNGDGRDDLIDRNGWVYANGPLYKPGEDPAPVQVSGYSGGQTFAGAFADINGDGNADFLGVEYYTDYTNQQGPSSLMRIYLCRARWDGKKFMEREYITGNLIPVILNRDVTIDVGDFNGDGYPDFWVQCRNPVNYFVRHFIVYGSGILIPYEETRTDMTLYGNYTVDIEGDGTRQMFFPEAKKFLRVKKDPYIGYYVEEESLNLVDANGIRADLRHSFPGDFNGDGKTDLLAYYGNQWHLFHSNGREWKEYSRPTGMLFTAPDLSGQNAPYSYVMDINSDGMDDFIQLNVRDNWISVQAFLSDGNNFRKKLYHNEQINAHVSMQSLEALNPGDYNGDGLMEFFCKIKTVTGGTDYIYFNPFQLDKKPLLASVEDGMGRMAKFDYCMLAQNNIYRNTKDADRSYGFGYSFQTNACVAKSLKTSNGLGGFHEKTVLYLNGLLSHLYGGFLGFQEVRSTDQSTRIKTLDGYAYPVTSPYPAYLRVYYSPGCGKEILPGQDWDTCSHNDELLRLTTYRYRTRKFGNKAEFHYPDTIYAIDYLTSDYSVAGYAYDTDNGNVTYQMSAGTGGRQTITTETRNTYLSYGNYGIKNKLTQQVTSKSYDRHDMVAYYDTVYSYDTRGNLIQKRYHRDTTRYVLNGMGLPVKVTQTALGLPNRYSDIAYDGRGRFVTQITDMNGLSTQSSYGPFGNLLQTVDPRGNKTSYGYDGFGRLTWTSTPVGTTRTALYWSNGGGPANTVYFSVTEGDNRPPVTVYYDLLGRELRSVTLDFQKREIFVDKEYDAQGRLYRQSRPYFQSDDQRWTTYTYDIYGRPVEVNDHGMATTTRYNHFRHVVITRPDGTSLSKTTNALGQPLSCTDDNGNTITYSYHGSGQPDTITVAGVATTMEYAGYGYRQSKLTDPNAGTTTYEYNNYGELIKQTDARGHITQMGYLTDGRLSSKTTTEGTYNYTYYTSGISKTLLQRETAPSGAYFEYEYDELGRQTRVTQSEPALAYPYTTSYIYDDYGNLSETYFPTNLGIHNRYDDYGFGYLVEKYKWIPNAEGELSSIWLLEETNALGQVTKWTAGNSGLQPTRTYDSYDMLSSIRCGNVQNMSYSFRRQNGNLEVRTNHIRNLSEMFFYDNLDRLTEVLSFASPAVNQGITYEANGNIATKSDAGTYTYHNTKKHALTAVTGPNDISLRTQTATYTSFSSVSAIKEYINGANMEAVFHYAPDNQRSLMQVYKNTNNNLALQYTKFYGINFEQYTKGADPNNTANRRNFHYISAPGGARMLYVSTGDVRMDRPGQLYYLLTDHQGSMTHIVNEAGNLMQEYAYDAWGRRRNPADGQPYTQSTQLPLLFDNFCTFDRGYTGHEHLDGVGLINMNGRLYDPVMARMLSPDNYVQNPENTQNYNRYSYCMNNPLKYVDPTGMRYGKFVNENGAVIGEDGIDDNKVYVIKTTQTAPNSSKFENPSTTFDPISTSERDATVAFIQANSGNTAAFEGNDIAYRNSAEIQGSADIRQGMADVVNQDNGRGGTKDSQNMEYGGNILNGDIISTRSKDVGRLKNNESAELTIDLLHGSPSFHSHASGTYVPLGNINVIGGTTTVKHWNQSPSKSDINNAGNNTHYVFGRGNGTVYIYNSQGVQATIPQKYFVTFK